MQNPNGQSACITFNTIITDWGSHLVLLTNFWETELFLKRKYYGNPVTAHQEVDDKMNHTITSEHFGLCLIFGL